MEWKISSSSGVQTAGIVYPEFTVLVSLVQAHLANPQEQIIRLTLNTGQIDEMVRAIRSSGQINARIKAYFLNVAKKEIKS